MCLSYFSPLLTLWGNREPAFLKKTSLALGRMRPLDSVFFPPGPDYWFALVGSWFDTALNSGLLSEMGLATWMFPPGSTYLFLKMPLGFDGTRSRDIPVSMIFFQGVPSIHGGDRLEACTFFREVCGYRSEL